MGVPVLLVGLYATRRVALTRRDVSGDHREELVGASMNVTPAPTLVPAPFSSLVPIVRPVEP